jgi:methylated-DNA-[protein]-cysteine S-methyltransferase
MSDDKVHHRIIPSRFGEVVLVWREDDLDPKILGLTLPRAGISSGETPESNYSQDAMGRLCEQIARYLDGEALELPIDYLDSTGCSEFQWRVLNAEKAIPRGYVCSYGQLAAAVGKPKAARAVRTALARNPFPIIIPCHRTVRRDGRDQAQTGSVDPTQQAVEGTSPQAWTPLFVPFTQPSPL